MSSTNTTELFFDVQQKTDKQHILDNPDTYIGSVESIDANMWIMNDDNDKIIEKNGVKIIGYSNYASRTAYSASGLLAKNIINFLSLLVDKEEKTLKVDFEDEIIKGVRI